MNRLKALTIPALLILLSLTAVASETVIDLDAVISRAVSENLDVRVESLNPKIKEAMWLGERSIFDTYFSLELSTESSQNPQSSSFLAGGSIVKTDTDIINFGVTRKFASGTRLNFNLYDTRRESTASINDLNPYASVWAALSLEQPLLKGFGIRNNRKSVLIAANNKDISDAEFILRVSDVVSSASQSYWNLIYFREDLDVKKQSLKLAEELLEHTKIRVDVGVLAPIEITQAEAGVASRKESVIIAENYVQQMEDALCRLLNFPTDNQIWEHDIVPAEKPEVAEIVTSLEASTETALKNRVELKNAELMLQNGRLDMQYYKNSRLPALNLKGNLGYAGLGGDVHTFNMLTGDPVYEKGSFSDAYDQIYDRDFKTWSVGVSLSYPLFNRSARGAYQSALLGFQQTEFYTQQVEQMVRIEVRDAVRQLETDLNRVEAAKANRVLQQKKLEAEEERYKNGLSTSYNVLDFQEDLAFAQSAELKAVIDYNIARIRFEQAQGTLLESFNIKIEE